MVLKFQLIKLSINTGIANLLCVSYNITVPDVSVSDTHNGSMNSFEHGAHHIMDKDTQTVY